jgi:hypothetical protein
MCVTNPRLLDDLVGTRKNRRRHLDAEGLGSLQIDHQFVFGRRLHRKVGRFLTFY